MCAPVCKFIFAYKYGTYIYLLYMQYLYCMGSNYVFSVHRFRTRFSVVSCRRTREPYVINRLSPRVVGFVDRIHHGCRFLFISIVKYIYPRYFFLLFINNLLLGKLLPRNEKTIKKYIPF